MKSGPSRENQDQRLGRKNKICAVAFALFRLAKDTGIFEFQRSCPEGFLQIGEFLHRAIELITPQVKDVDVIGDARHRRLQLLLTLHFAQ